MTTKYAVFNPLNGQYTKADTKEEAYSIIVNNVLELYKVHSNNYSISTIEIDANGNETWVSADNGTELPAEYIEQIKAGIAE
jgi:hypothetical protein